MLIAAAIVAAAGGYFLASGQADVYEAQTRLIVGQSLQSPNLDYEQLIASHQLAGVYAEAATTQPILESVRDTLQLEGDWTDLAQRVQASAGLDSALLSITVQDGDPDQAALIANTVADALIAASPTVRGLGAEIQRAIDEDLQATRDQIASTQRRIDRLEALPFTTIDQEAELLTLQGQLNALHATFADLLPFSSSYATNRLSTFESATPPSSPTSPRPFLNAVLAAMLGLFAAAAVMFLPRFFDDRLRSADDVRAATDLPALGVVNDPVSWRRTRASRSDGGGGGAPVAMLHQPRSSIAEAYRRIRWNVELSSLGSPLRTMVVTSSTRAEGKSIVAANLAVAFAQAGRRVLLVDADLRRPELHALFGLPEGPGLTTLVSNDSVTLEAVTHGTAQPGLSVLTSGERPANPAEVVGSARMRSILEMLQTSHDLVILDSPPLRSALDGVILSSFLDAAIFVVDAGHTRRPLMLEHQEGLERGGARVLGTVLLKVPGSVYSDHPRHPHGTNETRETRARAAAKSTT